LIAPGRSERELQLEIEAAFLRNGGDALAYETIVAGGPNTAVLHFMPTSRVFADGELVLVDAGAEVRGYASDITRTYPGSGSCAPSSRRCVSTCRSSPATASRSSRGSTSSPLSCRTRNAADSTRTQSTGTESTGCSTSAASGSSTTSSSPTTASRS